MNNQDYNRFQTNHSDIKEDNSSKLKTSGQNRNRIKSNLIKNYRRVRKYVRAHPGVGLTAAFVSGIVAEYLLSDSKS